jgi:hypothetical protein
MASCNTGSSKAGMGGGGRMRVGCGSEDGWTRPVCILRGTIVGVLDAVRWISRADMRRFLRRINTGSSGRIVRSTAVRRRICS